MAAVEKPRTTFMRDKKDSNSIIIIELPLFTSSSVNTWNDCRIVTEFSFQRYKNQCGKKGFSPSHIYQSAQPGQRQHIDWNFKVNCAQINVVAADNDYLLWIPELCSYIFHYSPRLTSLCIQKKEHRSSAALSSEMRIVLCSVDGRRKERGNLHFISHAARVHQIHRILSSNDDVVFANMCGTECKVLCRTVVSLW